MRITLFAFFLMYLPLLSFGQCYQAYKTEGDLYHQNAVFEEAITRYLAALLCPDLEQDQRIELIEEIKKALQARVNQLEAANEATQVAYASLQNATRSILDNILELAKEDLLNLNYQAALAKIQNAAQLKVDDEKVGLAMMELVYFFNESGQHQRAISLSDTLSNLLKIEDLAIAKDSLNAIRAYLSEANSARYQQLEERYYPIMIKIPGGTFEMGCNDEIYTNCNDDETPHKVKLSAYRIAKYETTNWQYHLYCVSSGQDSIERTREAWPLRGDLPVVSVNWYDGIQYCEWLNKQKGKENPFQGEDMDNYRLDITKNGYRLPTEAEWEYAAQGGLAKKETIYSGSDKLEEVGWYFSNSNSQPHQVGSKKPNGLNLYDMSGNVYEWCWDWYGNYKTELEENPIGANSGSRRVLRGGSWIINDYFCRVSSRDSSIYSGPYSQDDIIGFRVAQGF